MLPFLFFSFLFLFFFLSFFLSSTFLTAARPTGGVANRKGGGLLFLSAWKSLRLWLDVVGLEVDL